jgi:hypothetical protein
MVAEKNMGSNNGWIMLHRKIKDWEWYQDLIMFHLFIHLLLLANHENGRWRGVAIQCGQLVTGRKSLSRQLGMEEGQLRSRLEKLEKSGEITIKSTNKFSVITIVNYGAYQKKEIMRTNENDVNQPKANQQSTTNKNVKNVKKEENNDDDIPENINIIRNTEIGYAENGEKLFGDQLQEFVKKLPSDEAYLCKVMIRRGCDILSSFPEEINVIRKKYEGIDLEVVANKIRNWSKPLTSKNAINIISGFCDRSPLKILNKEFNFNKFKTSKKYGRVCNIKTTSKKMVEDTETDEDRARKVLASIEQRCKGKEL